MNLWWGLPWLKEMPHKSPTRASRNLVTALAGVFILSPNAQTVRSGALRDNTHQSVFGLPLSVFEYRCRSFVFHLELLHGTRESARASFRCVTRAAITTA